MRLVGSGALTGRDQVVGEPGAVRRAGCGDHPRRQRQVRRVVSVHATLLVGVGMPGAELERVELALCPGRLPGGRELNPAVKSAAQSGMSIRVLAEEQLDDRGNEPQPQGKCGIAQHDVGRVDLSCCVAMASWWRVRGVPLITICREPYFSSSQR